MRKGEGQCSERVLGMVSACISYLVRSFGVFCTVHLVLQGGKACENKLKEREKEQCTLLDNSLSKFLMTPCVLLFPKLSKENSANEALLCPKAHVCPQFRPLSKSMTETPHRATSVSLVHAAWSLPYQMQAANQNDPEQNGHGWTTAIPLNSPVGVQTVFLPWGAGEASRPGAGLGAELLAGTAASDPPLLNNTLSS